MQGEDAAEEQHDDLAEERTDLQIRQQRGAFTNRPDARGEHHPQRLGESVELGRLLAESLDDPDTGDGLLGHRGHLGLTLLRCPRRRIHLRVHASGDVHEDGEDEHEEHRERWRQDGHDDDSQDDLETRPDDGRQQPGRLLDEHQVGVDPSDQRAALHAFVRGRIEMLEVVVEVVADVVLDVQAEAATGPTPGARQQGTADGERDEQEQPRDERTRLGHERVVDHDALDERRGDDGTGPQHDRDQRGQENLAVPRHIRRQPAKPPGLDRVATRWGGSSRDSP